MPRVGLTPSSVVDAALELVDRDGVDALSLAAVADHVGVRSPSLYRHVDGLDGLREQMAVRVLDDLADAIEAANVVDSRAEPETAVRAGLGAYRSWVRQWPRRYALVPVNPPLSGPLYDGGARIVDLAVGWVAPWNLEGDDAIHAVRGLRSLVHGFCVIEVAGGFALDVDVDASFDRILDIVVAGLASP